MKRTFFLCLLLIIEFGNSSYLHATNPPTDGFLKNYSSQIYFEENLGQYSSNIHFQATVHNRQLRFLNGGISFAEIREIESDSTAILTARKQEAENYRWSTSQEAEHEALVWNLQFVGLQANTQMIGKRAFSGQFNYFFSKRANDRVKGVKRYEELWYNSLYNQIHLRFYGTADQQIKYDFVVLPGGDVNQIQMRTVGIKSSHIDDAGKWIVQTEWGEVIQNKPYAYQEIGGMEIPIAVSYSVLGEDRIGFEVEEAFDPAYPLIIDPLILNWSSFLHSSTSDDYLIAIDRDADDYIYMTGYTKTMNFPITPGIYQNVYGGGIDCYVTKLNPAGTALEYSTFIGGTDWEMGYGLAVNSSKEVFIAGFTKSTDYPISTAAYQSSIPGTQVGGFVTKLNAHGDSLIYSTYFGGSSRDYIYDLEINSTDNAYIAGYTYSSDFPSTPGAFSTLPSGNGDAFVSQFSADGSSLVYSTLFGGNSYDIANSLILGSDNEAIVAGNTGSSNLPVTAGCIQPTPNFVSGKTPEDAFLFRLSKDGSTLIYSTYLGGTDSDGIYSVDIHPNGDVFLAGNTYSDDFPTSLGAYQHGNSPMGGSGDVFVAKIDSSCSQLLYATYVAGTDIDFVKSIQVNSAGEAHILGASRSGNWPVTSNGYGLSSMYDIFISVLSSDGSAILHSSLYGGDYNDYPRASGSLHLTSNKLIAGVTSHSPNVPMVGTTFQNTKTNGLADAPWILGISVETVLAAEIRAFNAIWDSDIQQVRLNWALEESGKENTYILERQSEAGLWTELEHQPGSSIGTDILAFSYFDIEAISFAGQHIAYRLTAIGINGEKSYSQIREVSIPVQTSSRLKLFPNPVRNLLHIQFTEPISTGGKLEILDVMGRQFFFQDLTYNQTPRLYTQELNVSNWRSGVYFLRFSYPSGRQEVQRFIIKR